MTHRHLRYAVALIAAGLSGGPAATAELAPAGPAAQPLPIERVAHPGAEPAAPAAEKPPVAPPRSVHEEAFDKAFKKATQGWMEDPLKHIEGDMSHCVGELAALKTDVPVQKRQEQATARLDAVIKLLERECNSGGGGGGGKPLGRSVIAKGPGGVGDMHDPKAGEKQWASLPPKQRDQILQSKTEGFPPGFEAILQSYYERLAQEQVDDAAGGGAAAAGTPTPGGGTRE